MLLLANGQCSGSWPLISCYRPLLSLNIFTCKMEKYKLTFQGL